MRFALVPKLEVSDDANGHTCFRSRWREKVDHGNSGRAYVNAGAGSGGSQRSAESEAGAAWAGGLSAAKRAIVPSMQVLSRGLPRELLSVRVLRSTVLSAHVPDRSAIGAQYGVLACYAGFLLGSIPPASISSLPPIPLSPNATRKTWNSCGHSRTNLPALGSCGFVHVLCTSITPLARCRLVCYG